MMNTHIYQRRRRRRCHRLSLLLCCVSSHSAQSQSSTSCFIAGRRRHDHDHGAAAFLHCQHCDGAIPDRVRTRIQTQNYYHLNAINKLGGRCDQIAIQSTRLGAFSGKRRGWQDDDDDDSNNYDDDDDDDDEPPSISISPQEFLYRLQQRQQQKNSSSGNNNSNNFSVSGLDELPSATSRPIIPPSLPGNNNGFSIHKYNTKFNNINNIEDNILRGKKGNASSAPAKAIYICTNCQSEYVQWVGKCSGCDEYNTIVQEYRNRAPAPSRSTSIANRAQFATVKPSSSSSWLDGISIGSSGGGGGTGPVRVTDVYQDMMLLDKSSSSSSSSSSLWMEAYSNGSLKERRTLIPDDPELNSVLGGGLMPGSITLVGGDPGVGKSTLLLQMAGSVASLAERSLQYQGIGMGPPIPSPTTSASNAASTDSEASIDSDNTMRNGGGSVSGPVIYISGEENANQIASRALRLGIQDPELLLWCETDADVIASTVVNSMCYGDGASGDPSSYFEDQQQLRGSSSSSSFPLSRLPSLIVIDSIQTMVCDAAGASSVGGITQVRECVGLFLRLAKSTGVPIMLVGHVTKSGDVAGPRTVEHMVDCVLYLEGGALLGAGGGAERGGGDGGGGISSLRVLRAAKNRFGSSEEVGVYEMGRAGRLIPISDPSSFFLSTRLDNADAEGCAISVVLEGIRSMTVEVQALVAWSAGSAGYSGRRIVDGVSNSRLLLILAVLHKRYGISFRGRDVYVNVVGGMHLGRGSKSGGGSDLAVAISIVSSLVGIPVRSDTAFVGEIGLLGELRPVHSLEKRISEARRMGFSRIVTPSSPTQKKNRGGKTHPGPNESSAGGIKQLMCDNLMDAINCGLVSKLPAKQIKSGATLNKARSNAGGRTSSFGMNDLDIIEDDEEDDYL